MCLIQTSEQVTYVVVMTRNPRDEELFPPPLFQDEAIGLINIHRCPYGCGLGP